jgi:hypothetical protein
VKITLNARAAGGLDGTFPPAEPIPEHSPRRFDHDQVLIHPDGTHVELGRGALSITFKAFDTVSGNEAALKVIDGPWSSLP